MSASTRIFLAVTALVVVVLVLYYGVFSGEPAPQAVRAAEEVEQPAKPEQSLDRWQETEAPPRIEPPRLLNPITEPPAEPIEASAEDETPVEEPAVEESLEDLAPVDMEARDERSGGKDGPKPEPADEGVEESETTEDAEDAPESDPAPGPEPRDPDRPAPPAPAPPPAPEPGSDPGAPQYTEYTVKANDTMSSIAAEWFGDASKWDIIAKANPLVDPARLRVGQVLRLPPKDTQRDDPDDRAGDKPIEYTVRSGDTLSKIARMYYGHERRWQRIYDANKSAIGDNPGNLKVGMKLTIPPAPSE